MTPTCEPFILNVKNRASLRQRFQITQEDVGTVKDHYNGYRYRKYKFSEADIGKVIEVIKLSENGLYSSWYFINED